MMTLTIGRDRPQEVRSVAAAAMLYDTEARKLARLGPVPEGFVINAGKVIARLRWAGYTIEKREP